MQGVDLAKQLAWVLACRDDLPYEDAAVYVKNFYSGSRAIRDPEVLQHLESAPSVVELLYQHDIIERFQSAFGPWLLKNQHNTIDGLESFVPDLSQGATQAFDSFFLRYPDRRIAFLQGEYFYHVLTAQYLDRPWVYVAGPAQLGDRDLLVLSWPFCDTGNTPEHVQLILEHCDHKGIPVLLDCAYFTLAHGIGLDLNHDCIKTVVFSLSKTFPVAHARIGMRYIRSDIMDGQRLHSNINYDNRISAGLGLHIIEHFSSDYVSNKYRSFSLDLSQRLGLAASQSVIFADGNQSWNMFGRKGLLETYGLDMDHRLFRNRICITALLEHKDVVCKILELM